MAALQYAMEERRNVRLGMKAFLSSCLLSFDTIALV